MLGEDLESIRMSEACHFTDEDTNIQIGAIGGGGKLSDSNLTFIPIICFPPKFTKK